MSLEHESRAAHPELGWAELAEQTPAETSEPKVTDVPDGSHERIDLPPHSDEPVTEAPDFTRNTPLNEVAPSLKDKVADLSPEDIHRVPEKVARVIADAPEKESFWTKPKKIGAAVVATLTLGGIIGGAVAAESGGKPELTVPEQLKYDSQHDPVAFVKDFLAAVLKQDTSDTSPYLSTDFMQSPLVMKEGWEAFADNFANNFIDRPQHPYITNEQQVASMNPHDPNSRPTFAHIRGLDGWHGENAADIDLVVNKSGLQVAVIQWDHE